MKTLTGHRCVFFTGGSDLCHKETENKHLCSSTLLPSLCPGARLLLIVILLKISKREKLKND